MTESELISLLKSYKAYNGFLCAQQFAKEHFNPNENITISDEAECREKMWLIEQIIKLLEPSDAYTLLHLHYIKNIPVEKCAECMNLSRSTAFRLLSKAHKKIYTTLQSGKRGSENE